MGGELGVDDGVTGLMFTPGDLGDLTSKLKRLLYDPQERARMGSAAREEMLHHNWLAATGRLIEFYELARGVHARFDPPSRY